MATTINQRLSDLRGFCKYLYKKNTLSLAEYEEIREISHVDDDRVIDFTCLSTNDVCLILKNTDNNREAIRDRFLLSLLYESGARINEVLSLKLLDIKPTPHGEADVHFYGKGKKHRFAPLSNEIGKQYNTNVTAKNIILTKARKVWFSTLFLMASKTRYPMIMLAVYWKAAKMKSARAIRI